MLSHAPEFVEASESNALRRPISSRFQLCRSDIDMGRTYGGTYASPPCAEIFETDLSPVSEYDPIQRFQPHGMELGHI